MMRTLPIIAGGAIALAAGAVALGLLWPPSGPAGAVPTAPPTATAVVTRGTLRDTESMTGTLGYGELSTLLPNLSEASAMVTWIAPVGAMIERGERIYALDGSPTVLFYGTVPQHRTLRFDAGGETPVWVELEQGKAKAAAAELTLELHRHRLADAQARIGDATARLEDALSPRPATAEFIELTGAVDAAKAKLKRVQKLSAAELTPAAEIAAAESELASAHTAVDNALRSLRKDVAAAQLDEITARSAVAEAQTTLDELRARLNGLAARSSGNADLRQIADNLASLGYEGALGDQVRAWQRDAGLPVTGIVGPSQLVVAPGPIHIAEHRAGIGETVLQSSQDGGPILNYSGIEKQVTVSLNVSDQALAAVGRVVSINLPDDRQIEGTILEVGSVVREGSIEVTVGIADQAALRDIEVAAVDVEMVSATREDVLSVPVAALLARPEGGFAVEVMDEGAATVVEVATGLFAGGRVEISGEGIAEGMRVGVPG